MKIIFALLAGIGSICGLISCSNKSYESNGESIYRTGRNIRGEAVLDNKRSSIGIFKSCQSCHGPQGDRMKNTVITYEALSSIDLHTVPYNDSLIIRFLDKDLESNGKKAGVGVRWKMNDQDKADLIAFLKTLQPGRSINKTQSTSLPSY